MYSKIFVSVLFSIVFALAAVAAPHPSESIDHATTSSGVASVVGNSITSSAAKGVFKTVTSVDGHAFTIITSKGGEGFTLAPSGVGVVTTVLGSVYTVATGATSIATSTPTSSSSNSESAPDAPKLDPYRVLAIFAGAFVIIFIILTILERFDKRPCQYCD